MTLPGPDPDTYPPIDPDEPVPDDPGELSPDTPETLPEAPVEGGSFTVASVGSAIKAVCVLRPSKVATADEIIDFVGRKIARYKKPKHVVFVDQLPKTAAGDIDRAAVKSAHGQA